MRNVFSVMFQDLIADRPTRCNTGKLENIVIMCTYVCQNYCFCFSLSVSVSVSVMGRCERPRVGLFIMIPVVKHQKHAVFTPVVSTVNCNRREKKLFKGFDVKMLPINPFWF